MAVMSAGRITGLFLIMGAVLVLVMIFLRPGSILVEPQAGGSMAASVEALAKYSTLTHVTSLLGALGLFMMLFGFYGIGRALGDQTSGDSLARFGILLLTFAIFCSGYRAG